MSTVPFTVFSTARLHKIIRDDVARESKTGKNGGNKIDDSMTSTTPNLDEIYNYNLKFMKSIWGLYNQYAPEAFQKNQENNHF